MTPKKDLVSCVKDLYYAGLTTSVSGNHSILLNGSMWITPSGVPRYLMTAADLVRVDVRTGTPIGKRKPSIESEMHRKIYLSCQKIKAIVHTHSPFTIAVSISGEFRHVIEEAKIVAGEPRIIPNEPSGSEDLARAVAKAFGDGAAAVVAKKTTALWQVHQIYIRLVPSSSPSKNGRKYWLSARYLAVRRTTLSTARRPESASAAPYSQPFPSCSRVMVARKSGG